MTNYISPREEQARLEGQRILLGRTTGIFAFNAEDRQRLGELNERYGPLPTQEITHDCKGKSAY